MNKSSFQIRRADLKDLQSLAQFGLALAQLHTTFDEDRFVVPSGGEIAFREYFERELRRADAVLLIAESDTAPIGYAFIRIEPASIEELRESGAWLHDLYVVPEARAWGAGRRLVEAAFAAARDLGSTSLMLSVSPHNGAARSLFERMGFRETMSELRAELAKVV